MPALTTQGLAAGFQQGFGMARQVAQDAQAQANYEAEQLAKQRAIQLEQERYNQRMAQEAIDRQNTADFRSQRLANDAAAAEATAAYRQTQADAAAERDQFARDQATRQELKERGTYYVGSATLPGFTVNEELEAELNKAGLTRFIPGNIVDTENLTTLNNLSRMGTEILNTGDLGRVNSPEFLDLYNKAFDAEISTGSGQVDPATGKVVKDKRVVQFRPVGEGKFVTEVALVFEDGTQSEPRPVTMFRSGSPNDPVAADDPGAMIDMVLGRAEVARRLGEMRGNIQSAYDLISGKKGEKLPATAATIDYYMGLGYTRDEAVGFVTRSKSDPSSIAARVAQDMYKNDVDDMGNPKGSFSTYYRQAYRAITGEEAPLPGNESGGTEQPVERPIIVNDNGDRMQLSEDGTTWEPIQ